MTADPNPNQSRDRLSRVLGVVSLGLGVPPLAAPARFSQAMGVTGAQRHRLAATAVGVRSSGLVPACSRSAAARGCGQGSRAMRWTLPCSAGRCASTTGATGGVQGVFGLRARLRRSQPEPSGRERTVAAIAAVAGITALDIYAATTRSRKDLGLEIAATTTVAKTPEQVYAFWRQLENLPTFMGHLEEVRVSGDGTSHWRASAPLGSSVEWDARIVEDVPGERIAWRSAEGADVRNNGVVRFAPAPGGRGTELHVTLRYTVPGGALGRAIARYFGEEPHQQLDDDLRRFKQVLETGEVVRSEGAPGGKLARHEFPQHAAQPLTPNELAEEARA